jgi:hypothetical protein
MKREEKSLRYFLLYLKRGWKIFQAYSEQRSRISVRKIFEHLLACRWDSIKGYFSILKFHIYECPDSSSVASNVTSPIY